MGAPRLLMLDEPSLGLAPIIVADIFRTIGELRSAGVSVLLASNRTRRPRLQIADRAYVMELGEFILNGAAKDIATNQRVAGELPRFQHEGASRGLNCFLLLRCLCASLPSLEGEGRSRSAMRSIVRCERRCGDLSRVRCI